MGDAPTLTVLVATRERFSALGAVLDTLLAQVVPLGGEVVVAGGAGELGTARSGLRYFPDDDRNILRLRAIGLAEARGQVVAMGEDHAYPTPGWAASVIDAHRRHPDAAAVLGCLVNTTDRTSSGRANFLTFAAPFAPPMPEVPDRPPPISVVSIKARELEGIGGVTGALETELLPRLHREGRFAADDQIQVDHRQDFGVLGSVTNGFRVARASYGYARASWSKRERRRNVRWVVGNILPRALREARTQRRRAQSPRRDLVLVAFIGAAFVVGAAMGTLFGPGRAPLRSA